MKPVAILGAFVLTACVSDPLAHIKHDPQEDDPRLRTAFHEADAYAERKTRKDPSRPGEVHEVWRYKKDYLLQKYGIRWNDPSETNPKIAFD